MHYLLWKRVSPSNWKLTDGKRVWATIAPNPNPYPRSPRYRVEIDADIRPHWALLGTVQSAKRYTAGWLYGNVWHVGTIIDRARSVVAE
jgi:hypothetical protein